jgi:hypothetical protein
MFKNFQIIFIEFYSLRAFQKYKENAQLPYNYFSFDLNEFLMKNVQYSINSSP